MRKKVPLYTFCGSKMDLNNFDATGMTIEEIARGLGNLCRYNGQVKEFYSVAEHSVILSRYFQIQGEGLSLQRHALMHDAAEAFIGDIVYHLKAMMPDFKEMEGRILDSIYKEFNLQPTEEEEKLLHEADRCICIDEMYHLMGAIDPVVFKNGRQPLHVKPDAWPPAIAIDEFIKRAKHLKLC